MGKFNLDSILDVIHSQYSGKMANNLNRVCANIYNSFGVSLPRDNKFTVHDLCKVLSAKYDQGEIRIGKNNQLERGNNNVVNEEISLLGSMVAGNARINMRINMNSHNLNTFVPGSYFKDCEIINSKMDGGIIIEGGMFTKINKSHIKEGTVFFGGAKVRDSVIGERNEIGQIEVVRSTTGELMKALHRGFIGDATLGNNINVSNFFSIMNSSPNGKKGIVRIGDNVFLGGASTVVSGENGIIIGDDAVIAAGATVLKDVPGGYIYISKDKMYPKDRNLEASK